MTREEAIRMLKYNSNVIHKTINGETDPNEVEALDMAIKALEQEPCEDCISREAVNDGFKKYVGSSFAYGSVWGYINNLPSVTPKEKIGKWETTTTIVCGRIFEVIEIECSCCKQKQELVARTNFCPNCGARMVSE